MAQHHKSRNVIIPFLIWTGLTLPYPLQGKGAFEYFHNAWTVIGLKDYAYGTRITPDNRLVIRDSDKKPSNVLIRFGSELPPLTRQATKRLMDGWLPVVLVTAQDSHVVYEFTFWATPLPSAKDWEKAFDWPLAGENFLNWIAVKITNAGQTKAEAKLRIEQSESSSLSYKVFAQSLSPGECAETVVSIPFFPLEEKSEFTMGDAKL